MLVSAGMLTAVVRVALAVGSLRSVIQGLEGVVRVLPRWSDPTPGRRERAAWAVKAVGRRLLSERPCLTQAIVLQYLLRRQRDESAQIRLGVARGKDGTLQAHAWVERNGDILIGGAESRESYSRFDNLEEKLTV